MLYTCRVGAIPAQLRKPDGGSKIAEPFDIIVLACAVNSGAIAACSEGSEAHRVCAAKREIEQKEEEVTVVVVADAVVHPRAVVIHAQHAFLAHAAVV